jgi:hypothetical protein
VLGFPNPRIFPTFTVIFLSLLVEPSSQFTRYTDDPDSCQLIGDPDIYGIGLRLSFYLAYASGLIALGASHHPALQDAKKGYNIITFAILIIFLKNTLKNSFALLEWSILFSMVFLLPVPVFMQVIAEDLRNEVDLIGSGIMLLNWGLLSVLQPWLWFTLKDQGRRPECKVKQFMAIYVDLYGHRYILYSKILAILYCVLGVFYLFGAVILIGEGMKKAIRSSERPSGMPVGLKILHFFIAIARKIRHKRGNTPQMPQAMTRFSETSSFTDGSSPREIMFTRTIAGLVGVNMIVITEKILSGNHLDLSDVPLSSTGQLIPFIVGLCTFISTLWSIFKDRKKGHRPEAVVPQDVENGNIEGVVIGNDNVGEDVAAGNENVEEGKIEGVAVGNENVEEEKTDGNVMGNEDAGKSKAGVEDVTVVEDEIKSA